jgi:hypothetical protein
LGAFLERLTIAWRTKGGAGWLGSEKGGAPSDCATPGGCAGSTPATPRAQRERFAVGLRTRRIPTRRASEGRSPRAHADASG